MAGEANITVIGNLGADPEIKFLPDGKAVCNLRVANNQTKNVDGKWETVRTNWYKIIVWGRDAEAVADVAVKGDRVIVAGRLSLAEFEKDGVTKMIPEVTADAVGVCPKPRPKAEPVDEGNPW